MFSVVIPTYKRPDLLGRLLESIVNQTLQPSEVIVVDDASEMPVEYAQCIEKYRAKIPNLHYQCMEVNGGAPRARNTGIEMATSEWVALVDDDDEWLPRKLEEQKKLILNASDRLGLVYTWTKAEGGEALTSYLSEHTVIGEAKKEILTNNFIMSASVVVRKSHIQSVGKFDESMPSCQDWDTWAKMLLNGSEVDVVPQLLTIYHRHGGESIGLSPRALVGYQLFLKHHFRDIIRYTSPLNILKKAWLFTKVSLLIHARS